MANWIATAHALPERDVVVQFVVGEREILLCGRYDAGEFRSRWSCHSAGEVSAWRALDEREARHENERVRLDFASARTEIHANASRI